MKIMIKFIKISGLFFFSIFSHKIVRFLSIRGLYEAIPEWRRSEGEEDSGIFPNQQIMGNLGPDGSLQVSQNLNTVKLTL